MNFLNSFNYLNLYIIMYNSNLLFFISKIQNNFISTHSNYNNNIFIKLNICSYYSIVFFYRLYYWFIIYYIISFF